MSGHADAFREKGEALRRKRAGMYFTNPGPWAFFFSEAGRAVTSHPSAVAVWLLVISKQPLPPKARERKRLQKLGLWPPKKPTTFSFPVEEGPIHGLGRKATLSGLRILHDVGAIDRLHPGSATRGDFAIYVLSERWRQWAPPEGGPNFEKIDWPKAKVIATRDDVSGQFVANRIGKMRATKSLVLASKATTKTRIVARKATTPISPVASKAMKEAFDAELPVAREAISLISPSLSRNSGDGREETKVSGEENKGLVVERDRLDSDKVRRTFEDQAFLPDFIVNDLFSLIGIAGSNNGDLACGPWAEGEPLAMAYGWDEEETL